ncbi:4Fe-4S dicluster domain-containing protein [Novibacillus thermophilus]|uniref:4Fe-4S dicluster domain-containing protein n=1 Tax=Novibacillus thermophilus TaxID=1471761 RepID=UPI003003082D
MRTQRETETRRDSLAYDLTFDCVQCGYCLPVCPTYESMEKETHSPGTDQPGENGGRRKHRSRPAGRAHRLVPRLPQL